MTRFKFLPKRKQYSINKLHIDQSKHTTPSSLPSYSSVTTNPNNYPFNTSPVDCKMATHVRIYSKTNYSFPPPSFKSDHSDFFNPAYLLIDQLFFNFHFAPLQNFFVKIEPLLPLDITSYRINTQLSNNSSCSCSFSTNN